MNKSTKKKTATKQSQGKTASANAKEKKLLHAIFDKQQAAFRADMDPSYQQRVNDLTTLQRMLTENMHAIKTAINQDFGTRSNFESNLGDLLVTGALIDYTTKHLKQWMKPQRRHVDHKLFPGAQNQIIPQPRGVVGIIVPWNFPIYLSICPIATALAAGNRAMVKMSENSRHLAKLLAQISPDYFPVNKLAFLDETGGVGIEFSKLPFDLIMFTGSPATGKAVMTAAAQNLTPVILELGGKNPAIIDPDFPLQKAVDRIVFTKQTNAGQVCLCADDVFVHETQKNNFLDLAVASAKQMIPDIQSPYFTSIINDHSMERLIETLEDARAKGADVIVASDQDIDRTNRKFPLCIVVNPGPDTLISQRESFGPILTLRTYRDPQDVISHINAGERPLGLYVFSENKQLVDRYLSQTRSGGVTVNNVGLHATQDDLPFGGVGHSGMGAYHGFEGFAAFSHMRSVHHQAKLDVAQFLMPPYTSGIKKVLAGLSGEEFQLQYWTALARRKLPFSIGGKN